MRLLLISLAVVMMALHRSDDAPRGELLFPLQPKHNHGSCLIELPNRDLLACWYSGSGERTADDVEIMGARRAAGSGTWSKPFLMADTPGFPDCNPCMAVDSDKRLWLFWPTILDNKWESALLKYRMSEDYAHGAAPLWKQDGVLHIKPGAEFQ